MIIKINKKIILIVISILLATLLYCLVIKRSADFNDSIIAGGMIHCSVHPEYGLLATVYQGDNKKSERFQRPSKESPYPNPFSFIDFQKEGNSSPLITKKFENAQDVILAYYGILRDASKMLEYSGGCGTVGLAGEPYPYAYELLTKEKQQELSFHEFTDSFEGIGYITLLKLIPAYAPPGTQSNIKYYMVEMEVITGIKTGDDKERRQGSQFAYYYGLVTVEETTDSGWKIKDLQYIPEDFLCAPMHNWFYLSDAVVQIVYGENLKLIDKIDKTEQKDDKIYIYASGNGKNYRFDFVRLTNGYDILLQENIFQNDIWKEVNLLPDMWQYLKLTINNKLHNIISSQTVQ